MCSTIRSHLIVFRTLCFKTIIIYTSGSSRYSSMSIVDFSVISTPLCSANTNSWTCWVTTSRLGASIIPYGPDISRSRISGAGNEWHSATYPEQLDWISSAGNDRRLLASQRCTPWCCGNWVNHSCSSYLCWWRGRAEVSSCRYCRDTLHQMPYEPTGVGLCVQATLQAFPHQN